MLLIYFTLFLEAMFSLETCSVNHHLNFPKIKFYTINCVSVWILLWTVYSEVCKTIPLFKSVLHRPHQHRSVPELEGNVLIPHLICYSLTAGKKKKKLNKEEIDNLLLLPSEQDDNLLTEKKILTLLWYFGLPAQVIGAIRINPRDPVYILIS